MDPMDLDEQTPIPSTACGFYKLPAEILLQLAGYLSQEDLENLIKASPRSQSRKLNNLTFCSKTFAPWRRRWAIFSRAYSAALLEAQDSAQWTDAAPEVVPSVATTVSSAQVHRKGTVKKGEKEKHLEAVTQNIFEHYGFLPPNWAANAVLSPTSSRVRELKRYWPAGEALRFPVITERMVFDVIKGLFGADEARGYLCLKRLGCELPLLRKELEVATSAPVDLIKRIVPHHDVEAGGELLQCYMLITAYLMFTSLEPSQLRGAIMRATPVEKVEILSDDRHTALTEYFCFLGLWMDLWEAQKGMMRFPRDYTEPALAFTLQNRRVLCAALKVATGEMFALTKPVMGEASGGKLSQPSSATAPTGRRGTLAPSKRSHSLNMGSSSQPVTWRCGLQRSNSWGLDGFGSQTDEEAPETPTCTLTAEQRRVVDTELKPGELMKVRAYAGTGKTRCLVEYANLRPRKQFLYVAFNKSAEVDAKLKFGCNVTCKTVHALAFNVISDIAPEVFMAQNDQTMPIPNYWGNQELVELLKLEKEQVIRCALAHPEAHFKPGHRIMRTTSYQSQDDRKKPFPTAASVANVVKKTLERFWNSVESDIQDSCLPQFMVDKLGLKPSVVLGWARDIWRDIRLGTAPWLPHDAYLKLMHLLGAATDGDERAFGKYDVILFDEAQDANPCMATIVLRQQVKGIALIVVGDPYQRIYSFRGAENDAFDDKRFPPQTTHYLTWSFRFGDGIASVANILLTALGEKIPVNGVRKIDSVSAEAVNLEYASQPDEPFTVIFRKNISLIRYAILIGVNCPNHKMYLKIHRTFSKTTLFNNLREAHALLYEGRTATTYPLKGWKTWADLKNHVEAEQEDGCSSDSPILSLVVRLENTLMKPDFPSLIQRVEANVLDDSEMHLADVILITAHQAKGLEWDRVQVFHDFKPKYSVRNWLPRSKHYREEACVLYVALTRARKELLIESPLEEWIAGDRGRQKTYLHLKPGTCRFVGSEMDPSPPGLLSNLQLSDIIISTHDLIPPNSFTGIIGPGPNEVSPIPGGAVCRTGSTAKAAHREVMCLRCGLMWNNGVLFGDSKFKEMQAYMRAVVLRIDGQEESEEEVVWCERSPWVEVWKHWDSGGVACVNFWNLGTWKPWMWDIYFF